MSKRLNKNGFTIVELVIVIAVIAILAAVMIPTFTGIVEKAQKSAALQEARSIMTDYVAYKTFENEAISYPYYIKIANGEGPSNAFYFMVNEGVIAKDTTPFIDLKDGVDIVQKDSDNDGWPNKYIFDDGYGGQ